MRVPAQVAGHPFHPMLIVFPIALWIFSLVCQLVYFGINQPSWDAAATYAMAGGIIGGLMAAMPGFADLLAIPHSRARTIALWHMSLNLIIVILFIIAFFVRLDAGHMTKGVLAFSVMGVMLLFFSGWLGGSLVYVHGIAVEPAPPEAAKAESTQPPPPEAYV